MVAREASYYQAAREWASDAVRLFRERGDDGGVMVSLDSCGWNSLELQDPNEALARCREALSIAARLGGRRWLAQSAAGVATALVGLHGEERAVQLAGAATALFEELGTGFDDRLDEEAYERAVAEAKSTLGDEAFAAAWARGQALTPDEIAAVALEE